MCLHHKQQDIIFKNGAIYQVAHDEGRSVPANNGTWQHEFDYRDIWGNLRLSFRDSLANPINGIYPPAVITQTSDYDAVGLEFNRSAPTNLNHFKFQKQERIADFGLNIDFFKYRPSDYTNGRFWMIDPLAEQYMYNSPYAFSENKFGRGVELEGLEMAEFSKVARFPWHEGGMVQVPNRETTPAKLEGKFENTLGVQGGKELRVLGTKTGVFFNAGSIKLADFSTDERGNITNELDGKATFERELSIGSGIIGGGLKETETQSQSGETTKTQEYTANIGPLEVEYKNTQKNGKNNSEINYNLFTTGGRMGVIPLKSGNSGGIFVNKVEGKLVVPYDSVVPKNYSSTDATRVSKPTMYIKN